MLEQLGGMEGDVNCVQLPCSLDSALRQLAYIVDIATVHMAAAFDLMSYIRASVVLAAEFDLLCIMSEPREASSVNIWCCCTNSALFCSLPTQLKA